MRNKTARRDLRLARHISASLLAMAVLASCATIPTKTPVQGDRQALLALVGEWEGTYESRETGRSGEISFTLRAGVDTALGQVVMTPHADNNVGGSVDGRGPTTTAPELLTIRFVLAEGDQVYGVLDLYRDPVCGCPLETRFTGRRSGDTIRGKFVSEGSGIFHQPTSGEWRVTRKRVIARRE